MFIPIGDEPNSPQTPWTTYGLIAANVAVWLLICQPATETGVNPLDPEVLRYVSVMRENFGLSARELLPGISAYDILTFHWGFRPSTPSLVTLFTSLFLHGGWMHLLGNMLFLWIFGDNIEARLGPLRYLALYFASGVLATLFYAIFRFGSPFPLIGASGAISGILGAYFIWFGHNRVRVVMILVIFIQVIHVPARLVLGFYLLVENLLPFLFESAATSPTAYGAHIGGFFAGALFAVVRSNYEATGKLGDWADWLQTARALNGDARRQSQHREIYGAPTAESVTRAVLAGRLDDALLGYRALDEAARIELDTKTCFDLADALTQEGDYPAAMSVLQRFLADHPDGRKQELARAHLRLGLLQLKGMGRPRSAKEHFFTVLDLMPQGDEAATARAALSEIG